MNINNNNYYKSKLYISYKLPLNQFCKNLQKSDQQILSRRFQNKKYSVYIYRERQSEKMNAAPQNNGCGNNS